MPFAICHLPFAEDSVKRSCFNFLFSCSILNASSGECEWLPNQVKVIFLVKQMLMAHAGMCHALVIKRKKKPPRYCFLCHAWFNFTKSGNVMFIWVFFFSLLSFRSYSSAVLALLLLSSLGFYGYVSFLFLVLLSFHMEIV